MLKQLINESEQYAPYYHVNAKTRFSNHLPMVLIALEKMGADNQKLYDYLQNNQAHLEPIIPTAAITDANFTDHLGQHEAFQGYLEYFNQKLQQHDIKTVLDQQLTRLAPGISAHAFHPLIRIAYGIDSQIDSEIIHGLAYLASTYQELGSLSLRQNHFDLITTLEHLNQTDLNLPSLERPGIAERQLAASKLDFFKDLNQAIYVTNQELNTIGDVVMQLHLNENNLITLHGITSHQALESALPFITDKTRLLSYYTQGIIALYISLQTPVITEKTITMTTPLTPFSRLFEQVLNERDAHTIKLVYSCYKRHQSTNNNLYHKLANSMVNSNYVIRDTSANSVV